MKSKKWEGGDLQFLPWVRGDVAVLAGQVTDLACFRFRGVARRSFATTERVEVAEGTGAVAVGWNGLIVDVID